MQKFKNKKAFTLIELLIVIAIIGILFIVLVSKVDFATDKAKTSGVQTDFRSFQMALETVSKEKAGFNSFGWNTGDANANGVRDSVDEGDANEDGMYQDGETWTGHKKYLETWDEKYSLIRPGTTFETDGYDKDAIFALETAINKNLDPKLHITIDAKTGLITMANGAQDPWDTQYHGAYISAEDGMDRGAIVMYSNGANQKFGSEHDIANGVPTVVVPDNNKNGADDYSLVVCYTYTNGFGEVGNLTTGFSNNQVFLAGNGSVDNIVTDQPDTDEPENLVAGATFNDGVTLTWDELKSTDNGTKYGYNASKVTDNTIGYRAFRDCTSLKKIVIPGNITDIDYYAFNGCSNLENIFVMDENSTYHASNNCLIKTVDKVLVAGCKNSVIPSDGSVTSIGYYAFYNCTSLTNITIPDSVTSIGMYAFYRCTSLVSVNFGEHSQVTEIEWHTFYGCTALTSISIPNSVVTIDRAAFYGCNSLAVVTIGNQVETIGNLAFMGCSNIKSISIPDSVTDIQDSAFAQCTNLTDVTIGRGVQKIGYEAFYKCPNITNVYITDLSSWCGIEFYDYKSNPLYYEKNVYINGELLSTLVLPDNITSVSAYAFYGCISITEIVIPSNITEIKGYAFYGCEGISSLEIPNNVTTIGNYAFCGCKNVLNLILPDSITTIKEGAFANFISLTTLDIPSSVTTIGTRAFSNAQSLKNITSHME